MKLSRRSVYFVLLNIVVSACVTLTLLYIYERYFRASMPVIVPPVTTQVANGTTDSGALDIVSVIGAGVLENESVQIRNNGGNEINLTGWKLQGANGKAFTFPSLTLLNGGTVTVHTGAGNSTVVDLYWGLSQPLWESGQLVILQDATGNVRALYRIP
jgi:Lamin Tail Domain